MKFLKRELDHEVRSLLSDMSVLKRQDLQVEEAGRQWHV